MLHIICFAAVVVFVFIHCVCKYFWLSKCTTRVVFPAWQYLFRQCFYVVAFFVFFSYVRTKIRSDDIY